MRFALLNEREENFELIHIWLASELPDMDQRGRVRA